MNVHVGKKMMHTAEVMPQGIRSDWMLAGGWIALILGLFGSVVSAANSGDTIPGFLFSTITNPILWLAVYWFWRYTKVKCPHCGGLNSIDQFAVGSTIRCRKCSNPFAKPSQSQAAQPVQVIIAPPQGANELTPPTRQFSEASAATTGQSHTVTPDPKPRDSQEPDDAPQPQMIFTLEDAIKYREYEESLKTRIKDEDEARRRDSLEYEARVKGELAERDAQRQREQRERDAELDERQRQAQLKHAEELAALERERHDFIHRQTELSTQNALARHGWEIHSQSR